MVAIYNWWTKIKLRSLTCDRISVNEEPDLVDTAALFKSTTKQRSSFLIIKGRERVGKSVEPAQSQRGDLK